MKSKTNAYAFMNQTKGISAEGLPMEDEIKTNVYRKEEVSAVCSKCEGTTNKIYPSYSCADCYISLLTTLVEEGVANVAELENKLEDLYEQYRKESKDSNDLVKYKCAYEMLVKELKLQ